jgi:aspartyl-tRNA(Asn)/glutamyl-tRNA(Gln) amidotransferase subunit A
MGRRAGAVTDDLAYLTIAEAGRRFRAGTLQPAALVEALLARIDVLDGRIDAWVAVWREEALAAARAAGAELAAGRDRGTLHGIPIGLKDLIDVAGCPTLAGAPELWDCNVAPADAAVVTRLRAAGAVLLGKTRTHPLAMGTITPPTRNPWDLERVPGGSSGGSAAALAAGMVPGALGSDTGGSIRLPAALCGVTGLKPTYGRVSRRGVLPLAWSLDHVGPLARTVEDCALLLQVLAGHDAADPRSVDAPVPDYLARRAAGVGGLRIGRLQGPFVEDLHPAYPPALAAAAAMLEQLGAQLGDAALPFAGEAAVLMETILPAEAATIHHARLQAQPEAFHPTVGPRLAAGLRIPATSYLQAQRLRVAMREACLALFTNFDLLLAPTDRQPAPLASSGVGATNRLTAPFNLTGFPALALPCGFTADGLPLGLQLVAAPWAEELLIQAGCAYQRATDWHEQRPPR